MPTSSALDLERFVTAPWVDFLHYGHGIELWPGLLPAGERVRRRGELVTHLRSVAPGSGLAELVGSYRPSLGDVPLDELRQGLQDAQIWREQFRALGCRGFSYVVDTNMRDYNRAYALGSRLARRIDLRIALVPDSKLFYPPRVTEYLRRTAWTDNHYYRNGLPSIAFALGRRAADAWYVFAMQSDLVSRGPSYVRDHFRGWRHVLFANLVAHARRSVGALYLCRAEDVERARYRPDGAARSDLWPAIYDRTADEWGMRLVKVAEPVNVQLFHAKRAVPCEHFYELRLGPDAAPGGPEEATCTGTR